MVTPKPTILCFHGSGSNGMIFNVQLARLARLLRPTFDLITVDGPFVGKPGPGVLPFFEGCGPYAYWTYPERNNDDDKGRGLETVMHPEAVAVIMDAVRKVEAKGGEVVGACGFSQGSRVVAGLLKVQEERKRRGLDQGDGLGGLKTDLKFGIVFNGSYPPPLVPLEAQKEGGIDEEGKAVAAVEERITTPTLHVQGVKDPWNWAGRKMLDECYEASTAKVVSVLTEHHMPVSPDENEMVKKEVMRLWNETR